MCQLYALALACPGTTYDDGRPTLDTVPQLYIDPVECIDCGACVPVCPVSAIFSWRYVKAGKFTPGCNLARGQLAGGFVAGHGGVKCTNDPLTWR